MENVLLAPYLIACLILTVLYVPIAVGVMRNVSERRKLDKERKRLERMQEELNGEEYALIAKQQRFENQLHYKRKL